MRIVVVVLCVLYATVSAADMPRSTAAIHAQREFEDAIRAAEDPLKKQLTEAAAGLRKAFQEAIDAALLQKDLMSANEIDAALKKFNAGKPFSTPRFNDAIIARRAYEDSVNQARRQYRAVEKMARQHYQESMQGALDIALKSKDLDESNRISDAMKHMQRLIAVDLERRGEALTTVTNSVNMTFVWLPRGEFLMGSTRTEKDRQADERQHRVHLNRDIAFGVHEVTQEQYERVMGVNPSRWRGKSHPVDTVSWHDAVAFCELLSQISAEQESFRSYRLPTEAEWEYACRAGTDSPWSFGVSTKDLDRFAWARIRPYSTQPVGTRKPNPWGIFDLHGNVWEWCQDWYGPYDDAGPSIDPGGVVKGADRVIRGGAFFHPASQMRSAHRSHANPETRDENASGFRIVLESIE
ncbi:MAG: formylglycine-generating enzyme family protein [Planctomycetaceae bacterium]